MQIKVEVIDGIAMASLAGEVNSRTANLIEDELLPLVVPDCRLLLDMRGVDYMSSAGLRMLLLLHREAENKSGKVVLVGLQEMIRDTMSITGFLDFFQDYETINEGVKALGRYEAD